MENATYENCPTDKNEWLKKRKTGIGGSDAAAICGISPYRSPVEVWLEKTNRLEAQAETEPIYWGQTLEPIVREEFVKRTGLTVYRIDKVLRHTVYPFMIANLDGIVCDPVRGNCIFEAKTASAFKASQWENGIPDDYMLQLQHYMAVTGYSGAYIAALIGGNDFVWHFIERDDSLISMLIDIESDFWDYVLTDTRPTIDGSDASSKLLNELFPVGHKDSTVSLPDYAEAIAKDYEHWKAAEKTAANQKQLAENQLKELLTDRESGRTSGFIIKWSNVNTNRFDTDLFKKEQPDLFTQYLKSASSRRFTVKGEKTNESTERTVS